MSLRDFNEGDHPGGDREWEDVEEGGEEAGVEEVRESPQQERQQERRQQGRQQQRRQQGRQQQRRQQGRHQQRRQQGRQQESQQQSRQQESQQQSRQQQDKQSQRRQEGQHEGTGHLIPSGLDNDNGARSLDARVAPLRSLNDRAFLDIIRIVELHRLRIFRQCDQFFLPCPRILELATVFPPRNIFDFLAVTRSRQDGGPSEDEPEQGSPVSARHGSSLYSTLFWEGPEALAGIPSCDNSVINPRGVVYFRCLILDILVFIIRRYGAAAILEQFRHWVGEHAQGSAVTLEEDLRTTIGSISLLTNVLETDMNRPNSVNRDCTGMGTSGREPQSTGTGTIGRESRFMGTGASGSVSQSLGTGTSENLEGSNRTDTNSGGPIVPTSCNVHTRNLQMSIVIYLNGVLALFVQYYNAWSQLQGILEAWRNRLETSSTAVRGRGSRSRPRNRRHNQHEPCSIS